ncbi:SAM-dependent methyltransferase [Kordiimonas sediminis]|uniref:SAM-dependent methyltransferase n=2 Tax=Kordiimonas sediminis TaxID=1735581 RepID=A0A919AUD1_9PROT|nr:SAM-dependent methyltransferase [Kordiimonas sediminis]
MLHDTYYEHVRDDIFGLLPNKIEKILEIGCGAGGTLNVIRAKYSPQHIVGIDISETALKKAGSTLNEAYALDLNTQTLPDTLGSFDTILCLDVLEHLMDPWETLNILHQKLDDNGTIVLSLPNIRYIGIIFDLLLKGKWEYTDAGILDRTHLRFFTQDSLREMIENANFHIEILEPKISGRKRSLLNKLSFNVFSNLLAKQYLVKAKKVKS